MIERDDGTLCLPTKNDPGAERALGHRRYFLGCDPGQQDPTALVLLRDERIPFWDGGRQKLGDRQRAIVWCDTIKDTSYTAILQYLVDVMNKPAIRGKVKLGIDATGLGRPLSDFLIERQVSHVAVTIMGGATSSTSGYRVNVGKTDLLGVLANHLETGGLTVAGDLPMRDQLIADLSALEIKITNAGNQVLDAKRKDGSHSDLAIAAAIALLVSNQAFMGSHEVKCEGYW